MKNVNRLIIYICGVYLLALGGVLAIKSNLGASPVSSLPLSISKVSSINLGTAAAILFITYVFIQMILLRKDFKFIQLLQIIFAILFGKVMDFFNVIININVDSSHIRILICLVSFFITALGVVLTITPNIVPIAPDGLTQVIGKKANIEFGKAKIYFDCIVVMLSITILLLNNKTLEGIGIGTILSALLVGRIVALLNMKLKHRINNICFGEVA